MHPTKRHQKSAVGAEPNVRHRARVTSQSCHAGAGLGVPELHRLAAEIQVRRVFGSGCNDLAVRAEYCLGDHAQLRTQHADSGAGPRLPHLAVMSHEAATNYVPSGLKTAYGTKLLCSFVRQISAPVFASHTRVSIGVQF